MQGSHPFEDPDTPVGRDTPEEEQGGGGVGGASEEDMVEDDEDEIDPTMATKSKNLDDLDFNVSGGSGEEKRLAIIILIEDL